MHDRQELRELTVTIAIPTFRRNEHLRELLPLLSAQADELERLGLGTAGVLIVDNDPDGGAAAVVRPLEGPGLRYVHEPRPGLAAVRNRALADAGTRLLAFMDDDGRPAPGWLVELVRCWAERRPAAVAGRVLEEYEAEPEPWIVAGGFFRRRSLVTGTVVGSAPAGNLLVDLEVVRRSGLRFDERFGATGGEDTCFTRQLVAGGGSIVWCEESQVVDQVPADRITRRWVLRRAWSHGNSAVLVDRALAGSPARAARIRVAAAAGGTVRIAAGGARHVLGRLSGSLTHQARGLRLSYRGAGMVAGALGHVVEEYRR